MSYISTIKDLQICLPNTEFLLLYDFEVRHPDPYQESDKPITTRSMQGIVFRDKIDLMTWLEKSHDRGTLKYQILLIKPVTVETKVMTNLVIHD